MSQLDYLTEDIHLYPLTILRKDGSEAPLVLDSGPRTLVEATVALAEFIRHQESHERIFETAFKGMVYVFPLVQYGRDWVQNIYLGAAAARKGAVHYVAQMTNRGNRVLVYISRHVNHSSVSMGWNIPPEFTDPHYQTEKATMMLNNLIQRKWYEMKTYKDWDYLL